jgi:hypothetical protein
MPPQAKHRGHDVELGAHERELWRGSGFGKNVSEIVFTGDESDCQGFGGDFVTNEVKVNFNVFCTSMEGGIGEEVGGPNVVTP